MFDKIRQLIAAYRDGDWKTAVKMILEVLREGIDLLPEGGQPQPMFSAAVEEAADKETDDLIAKLEVATENEGGGRRAMAAGPGLFVMLLPVLLDLLKRFLEKRGT